MSVEPNTQQMLADPANSNRNWAWIKGMLHPMGFAALAIRVKYSDAILINAGAGFERLLGEELTRAELGRYDSMTQGNPFILFYLLHRNRLDDAMKLILERLEDLKILHHCELFLADVETDTWRPHSAFEANPS